MSTNGSSKTSTVQRNTIWGSKMSKYFRRSSVSFLMSIILHNLKKKFYLFGNAWYLYEFNLIFRLPQIYEEFYHTVNNADHEKDLKWWSNTYGVNMPMNWPQFEVCIFLIFLLFFS